MKKAGLILILISAIFLKGYSQNVDDALRYSQIFYGGTARFMSMGGAFTALGGDLSGISLNPAGTGLFRSSEFSFSPQLYYNSTSSVYNKTSSSNFKYNLTIGQIGVVSNIISTGNETGLVSLNVAYSFNKTNNFNENSTIRGISDSSSMADYWARIANGKSKSELYNDLSYSDAWSAYETLLIDTLAGENDYYGTIFSYYGDSAYAYGQTIKRVIENSGFTGEHSFSIGANYSNKYYFGATLGINTIKYTGHYLHNESALDVPIYDFESFTHINHFEAIGTGYSLKIGTIIKPLEFLRFGFSLHSPVVYRIKEYIDNSLTTNIYGLDPLKAADSPYRYTYTFTTPFRALAGVAVQIKKLALLSADYEFVDYRMSQFSRGLDGVDYDTENTDIKESFKSTSNIRMGAEFRLNNLYFRGGYSYYGKVMKPGMVNQNLDYNVVSFGIGMRQQNFYFDLAYSALSYNSDYYMYYDPPYLPATNMSSTKNTFGATIGFKF